MQKTKNNLILRLVGGVLLTLILMIFSAVAVYAADTVEAVPDDCRLVTQSGDPNQTLPDSFSVSKCLSTSGQKGSKFLPTASASAPIGSPNESTMSAQSVLVAAIDVFVKIIATLSLIVFIIGAVITIVSNGNDDLLGRGKTAMIYSVVGLGVAMLSFLIIAAVQSLFFTN